MFIPKTMFEVFGWTTNQKSFFHSDEFAFEDKPGKAKPRSGSKSLDIGDYIGRGLEAGGRRWCLAGPPACLRNLGGAAPPPAVESAPDTNRTQWSTECQSPITSRCPKDQCVCQTLPAHTVHDTHFLLWCRYLVNGRYGRRSGKAGVQI